MLQARKSSRVHAADSVLQDDCIGFCQEGVHKTDIDEDNHEMDEVAGLKIMRLMRYLSQVELLDSDEIGEDTRAKLLDEVLPQGEDCDRLQPIKCPVRHL